MYNINSEVHMKGLKTYLYQKNGRQRIITTYTTDEYGDKMRREHQKILNSLQQNYQINYDLVYAYLPKQSISKLVTKHMQDTHFYTFDIKDFFGSIDHKILGQLLVNCENTQVEEIINSCKVGASCGIGLGLIPSPYLSNIYLSNFDENIFSYLQSLNGNINYSRYSDDILISSKEHLPYDQLLNRITEQLALVSLHLNTKKSRQISLLNHKDYIKFLGVNIIRGKTCNYMTISRKYKKSALHERSSEKQKGMFAYIDLYKS